MEVAISHAGHLPEEAVELAATFAQLGLGGLALVDVGLEQPLRVTQLGGAFGDLVLDLLGAASDAEEVGREHKGEREATGEDHARGGAHLGGHPPSGGGVVAAPNAASNG